MKAHHQDILPGERTLFESVCPLFTALGDPDRQDIVLYLAGHTRLSVKELTSLTELSRPTVSYHLKVLREAGLVDEEREGVKRYYQPTFRKYITPMRQLIDLVEAMERGRHGK